MRLRSIALFAGLIPLVTINVAYWIAQNAGHVPACIPYLDGCTTVSATARESPEALVFRAGMMSAAVVMVFYWIVCNRWLRCIEAGRPFSDRSILFLGIVGSLFLILHTTALGYPDATSNVLRRVGVSVYFLFTFVAQTILALRVYGMHRRGLIHLTFRADIVKIVLCAIMLGIGIFSIPVPQLFEDKDSVQDLIAWNFSVIMMLEFIASYPIWRATDLQARFRTTTQ